MYLSNLTAIFSFPAISSYVGVPASWPAVFGQSPDIALELGPHLSTNASIYLPGSADFRTTVMRWSLWQTPHFKAVVAVQNEQDIIATIIYANKYNIPFLAKVGGHGNKNTLGNLYDGIEVWMRSMNKIVVSPEGTHATIGGGVKVKEVTDALWAKGKQTVTGVCECVGMLSPVLGGGHGLLQGQHGLPADQIISARVVLANGTALTVSNSSHPDLLWGLRGAGHNFGIVTELEYRIYDVDTNSTWAYAAYIFTGDKLEEVFEANNDMMKSQPPEAGMNFAYITRVPAIDPVNPVIVFIVLFDGSLELLNEYSSPLQKVDKVSAEISTAPYPALAKAAGAGDGQFACQPGLSSLLFPIYLEKWDIPALRHAYDMLNKAMQEEPAFNSSYVMLENYAVNAVQAIPEKSTAFAHRSDRVLACPAIAYAPNETLDSTAAPIGRSLRELLRVGSGRPEIHSYVNYAFGDEDLQSIYGYEPWRLQELRWLKQQYDPEGKFNFYAPIV